MACYISSNNNRFYVAQEQGYGAVPQITAANRISAVQLKADRRLIRPQRKDKTGSRSMPLTTGGRVSASYSLSSYLTTWDEKSTPPANNPLFEGAMGGPVKLFAGGAIGAISGEKQFTMSVAHGLNPGDAVSFGGEIRFVSALVDELSFQIHAPFSVQPSEGSTFSPTANYHPGNSLKSVSIFDYWSPATSVQRILNGCAVDKLQVDVNSDFHGFTFSGPASEVMDNASFSDGLGSLVEFPAEPTLEAFDYGIVPGNLGQAWIGSTPARFYTLVSASIEIDNNIDQRRSEFGMDTLRCIAGGWREVKVNLSLYSRDDEETKALLSAAKQQSPVPIMFQLGEQPGQLFGIYMKSVMLEVPQFDDREVKLRWNFSTNMAAGTADDEISLAFA